MFGLAISLIQNALFSTHFLLFSERRKSSARDEQHDYRRNSQGNAEIIYTVTDVSQVEQGRGGFVSAVRGKLIILMP